MGRRIRFIPPDSLVEVTCRTVQGRCLLRPTPRIADLVRGVLARAVRLYPVQIHAFCFLSNHFHLLVTVPSAERLAAFMNYMNSNLAREVGRQVRWKDKFWGRRYQAVLVSDEEAAQVERLLYILRQGCKENLVRRPTDWPGASSTRALLDGSPVRGTWFDRTKEYRLAVRGRASGREEVTAVESFDLVHLPCWRDLPPERHRARCADLVALVEAETAARIRVTGREPLGSARLLRQDPHLEQDMPRKRPAPLVHAATQAVRRAIRLRYQGFVEAFRRASARFRLGVAGASEALSLFPPGSFPPSARFVACVGGESG